MGKHANSLQATRVLILQATTLLCSNLERPTASCLAFTIRHFGLTAVENLEEICSSLAHARVNVCLDDWKC